MATTKITPERYPAAKLMAMLNAVAPLVDEDDYLSPLACVRDLIHELLLEFMSSGAYVEKSDADLNWRTALLVCALMARVEGTKIKHAISAAVPGKNVPPERINVIAKYVQKLRKGTEARAMEVRGWYMDESQYALAEAKLLQLHAARSTGKKKA